MLKQYLLPMFHWSHFIQGGVSRLLNISWLLLLLKRLAADFITRQENLKHIKKTIGLQCLHTTPRRVTSLHDNRMNFNTHKNVFRDLDGISTSETWFPNKYIEDEINKKVDKLEINLQVMKWHMILDNKYTVSNTILLG